MVRFITSIDIALINCIYTDIKGTQKQIKYMKTCSYYSQKQRKKTGKTERIYTSGICMRRRSR